MLRIGERVERWHQAHRFGAVIAASLIALVVSMAVMAGLSVFAPKGAPISPGLLATTGAMTFVMVGVSCALAFVSILRRRRFATMHGSARWATAREIESLAGDHGIVIGGHNLKYDPQGLEPPRGEYLMDDENTPTLLYAPTGAGKGVGFVIPTLLMWNESAVVYDIKGENYAKTSAARRLYAGRDEQSRPAGSRILAFNPFASQATTADGEHLRNATYNPLQDIPLGLPSESEVATNIARMFVDPDGTRSEGQHQYWTQGAQTLLAATILHACYLNRVEQTLEGAAINREDLRLQRIRAGGDIRAPSMLDVIDQLIDIETIIRDYDDRSKGGGGDSSPIHAVLRSWIAYNHAAAFDEGVEPYWQAGNRKVSNSHPAIERLVGQMLSTNPKELNTFVSTAMRALDIFLDPVIRDNTEASRDHDGNPWYLSELRTGDQPTTLYLIIPPGKQALLRPLVRLMLSNILAAFTQDSERSYPWRLLFMIDEFPTLGNMDDFHRACAYVRGYGIKFYLVIQDLQQLWHYYGNNESFTGNSNYHVVFGPNNLETAEWVSNMIGTTTVLSQRKSTSGGLGLGSSSVSLDATQRPLITPAELRGLERMEPRRGKPSNIVILRAGHYAIRANAPIYFLDPVLMKLVKEGAWPSNSLHEADDSVATVGELSDTAAVQAFLEQSSKRSHERDAERVPEPDVPAERRSRRARFFDETAAAAERETLRPEYARTGDYDGYLQHRREARRHLLMGDQASPG